jgi:hypothetical protein
MKLIQYLIISTLPILFNGIKLCSQGVAINTTGSAPSVMLHVSHGNTSNNVLGILRIDRNNTTGGADAAAGIGSGMQFYLEGAVGGSMIMAADIEVTFDAVGTGAEEGTMSFRVAKVGAMTEIMRIDGSGDGNVGIGSTAPGAKLDVISTTATGTAMAITANSLTTGDALNISSTGTGLTSGSLLYVSSATTGAVATDGIVSFNATGNYTSASNRGLFSVIANATNTGYIQRIAGNALTSGIALSVGSNSTAFTGSLTEITLAGNNVANTGDLLNITSSGAASIAKALNISLASTGAYSNGGVYFNFSGAHTGNGFQIDDITTTGTVTNLTANSLTTGKALEITANSLTTGNAVKINSSSDGITTGSLFMLNSTGIIGNANGSVLNVTGSGANTNGYLATVIGNSVTSGGLLNVSSSGSAFTGTMANITLTGNNVANTGTLLKISSTGANNAGTLAMITNAGTGMSLRVNDDGTDTDASSFYIDETGQVGINVLSTGPLTSLDVNGGINLQAPATTLVNADNFTLTVGDRSYIKLDSDNSTPGNRTLILSNGLANGQLLFLEVVSGTNLIDFTSGASNMILGSTGNKNNNDTYLLIWDGGSLDWVQVAASDNP